MRTPTPEQRLVIDSASRIRVVRAVPGSGKTWLVAEIIRKEIEEIDRSRGGIAALSFTRVGGKEIQQAVGYELAHPHFVGTLDAFLFRYVVRPFLQQVYPWAARPRLIPADWLPEQWSKPPAGIQFTAALPWGQRGEPKNAFKTCFVGEDNGKIQLGHPVIYQSGLEILDDLTARRILKIKKQLWSKLGWLTHSDAAYLSTRILADVNVGSKIRAELSRRFPFLIVDELQDTGWFLGQSIKSLLTVEQTRGLLVGDPDQAIYEFNGARPDLFDGFSEIHGAVEMPLGTTMRCSPKVCNVANHLSQTGRAIQPNKGQSGRVLLLRYSDIQADMTALRQYLSSDQDYKCIRMVARKRKTLTTISGQPANAPVKLGSPPLNHMLRAVSLFRAGRQANALATARASIELALFGHEGREDRDLEQLGIQSEEWKGLVVECLLKANEGVVEETLYNWGVRTAKFIQDQLKPIIERSQGRLEISSIKKPQRKHQGIEMSGFLFRPEGVAQSGPEVPIQTVHAVKGETHDTTVLICPANRSAARCPTTVWWSTEPAALEEKRIVYVAITRTSGDLIICVCEQTWERFRVVRSDFVDLCEAMTVAEFLAIP